MSSEPRFRFSWERWSSRLPEKFLSLGAALLLFLFYRIDTVTERFFSVPVEVVTDEALTPGETWERRARVTLRGPEAVIFPILEEDIKVVADFSMHQSEGLYRAPLMPVRRGSAAGVENLEITLEPLDLTLTLEPRQSLSFEVQPQFLGVPAAGYEIESYQVTPSAVTVQGPRRRVARLGLIRTERIDLRGRNDSFSTRVRLTNEDALLSFPGGDVVEVRVQLRRADEIRRFSAVRLEAAPLPPGLRLGDALPNLPLDLVGSGERLAEIANEDLLGRVDLSLITRPGEYEVEILWELPEGVRPTASQKSSLVVEVEQEP